MSYRVVADKRSRQEEGKLTIYWEVVNYLVEKNVTKEVNAEAQADITGFKKPAGMISVCYSKAPSEKALRCITVYSETRLKGIFIKGISSSPRYSISTYWGTHKETMLHNLAAHARSVVKLQNGTHSSATTMREDIRS